MKRAIEEAEKTSKDNVPVGCVIVQGSRVISQCHNTCADDNDFTSHAEISAVRAAQKVLNRKYLDDCTMYVTLEPCPMCAWVILQSRIKTLYFGSYNPQYGAFGSALDLRRVIGSKIKVYGGIEEEKCDMILKKFFEELRKK